VRSCEAGDLQAVAGWQDAVGAMSGAVAFTNGSDTSCALQGRPGIHLLDATGALMPVANVDLDPFFGNPDVTPVAYAPVILLRPGEKSFVRFVWSNWCGTQKGPFQLAIALPGAGGQITVPARDATGNPLDTSPRCDATDVTSTISIGTFQADVGQ
jgi:hypothetical protein